MSVLAKYRKKINIIKTYFADIIFYKRILNERGPVICTAWYRKGLAQLSILLPCSAQAEPKPITKNCEPQWSLAFHSILYTVLFYQRFILPSKWLKTYDIHYSAVTIQGTLLWLQIVYDEYTSVDFSSYQFRGS